MALPTMAQLVRFFSSSFIWVLCFITYDLFDFDSFSVMIH